MVMLLTRVKYPPAGKYVVAVSGGVDSISLLDILAKRRDLDLVVAHFDHGWRADSQLDAEAVESLATILGLPTYLGKPNSTIDSEAAARGQRYDFLYSVAAQTGAAGVITAHHSDDRLETGWFNLARGTDRRGRLSATDRPGIYRPFREVTKAEIADYAAAQSLPWREDSTNSNLDISRNFIRRELLIFAERALPELLQSYRESARLSAVISKELDRQLEELIKPIPGGVSFARGWMREQSLAVIAELLLTAIRQLEPGLQLTRKQLTELALSAKTGRTGIKRDVAGRLSLEVRYDRVAVALPRAAAASNLIKRG